MVANNHMNTIDQKNNLIDNKLIVADSGTFEVENNAISRIQTSIDELKQKVVIGEYCIDVDKLSNILVRNM